MAKSFLATTVAVGVLLSGIACSAEMPAAQAATTKLATKTAAKATAKHKTQVATKKPVKHKTQVATKKSVKHKTQVAAKAKSN